MLTDEKLSLKATQEHLIQGQEQLRQELDQVRCQAERSLPDLEGIRDRVLADLRLGKQAPRYREAARVLDRFINDLKR